MSKSMLLIIVVALVASGLLIAYSYYSAQPSRDVEIENQIAEPEPETTSYVATMPEQPETSDVIPAQPAWGDAEAPVRIIEFADFYCPFCARYLWETYWQIERDYIEPGWVQYEFRNLVVHGSHALLTAAAGECAHQQALFHPFHDQVFETVFEGKNIYQHQQLSTGDLKTIAADTGLEPEPFNHCLDDYEATFNQCSSDYQQCKASDTEDQQCEEEFNACLSENESATAIFDDRQSLQDLLAQLPLEEKVQKIGTPAFFINNRVLIGAHPYEMFKNIIEAELKALGVNQG